MTGQSRPYSDMIEHEGASMLTTARSGADRLRGRGPATRAARARPEPVEHCPEGTTASPADNELARYLRAQLRARGKTLDFLAAFTGLDVRYLRRLASGEKRHPSTETLVKIAFGLVACEEQFRRDPRLPMVLSELLLAAGYAAAGVAEGH